MIQFLVSEAAEQSVKDAQLTSHSKGKVVFAIQLDTSYYSGSVISPSSKEAKKSHVHVPER